MPDPKEIEEKLEFYTMRLGHYSEKVQALIKSTPAPFLEHTKAEKDMEDYFYGRMKVFTEGLNIIWKTLSTVWHKHANGIMLSSYNIENWAMDHLEVWLRPIDCHRVVRPEDITETAGHGSLMDGFEGEHWGLDDPNHDKESAVLHMLATIQGVVDPEHKTEILFKTTIKDALQNNKKEKENEPPNNKTTD